MHEMIWRESSDGERELSNLSIGSMTAESKLKSFPCLWRLFGAARQTEEKFFSFIAFFCCFPVAKWESEKLYFASEFSVSAQSWLAPTKHCIFSIRAEHRASGSRTAPEKQTESMRKCYLTQFVARARCSEPENNRILWKCENVIKLNNEREVVPIDYDSIVVHSPCTTLEAVRQQILAEN
jgi:hypothetical protein